MRNLFAGRARFVLALVAVLVAVPAVASASHLFNDVEDSSIFHDDISWLAANGVTMGCDAQNYCPDKPITRGQMAAMLHRFADNIVGTPGIVNYTRKFQTLSNASSYKELKVSCNSGQVVIGGGFDYSVFGGEVVENRAYDDTTWSVQAYFDNGGIPANWTLTAHAICADVAP